MDVTDDTRYIWPMNSTTAVRPELVEQIKATMRENMGPFGLKTVEVRPGEDHDGDPVIFIDATYDLSETPIDTEVTYYLVGKMSRLLLDAGELRFPHIRNRFHELQKVAKPRRRKA